MIIHRWWNGPDMPHTRRYVEQAHPNHILIDHAEPRPEPYVYQSNILRLEYLIKFGGLWLDHDIVPLVDLTTVHEGPWTASIHRNRIGCVMFFPEPNNPWLSLVLEDLLSTGSGMLPLNKFMDESIGHEPRVVPFDEHRRRTGTDEPLAYHLWNSRRKDIGLPPLSLDML